MNAPAETPTVLVSGDSHVIEPTEIWDGILDDEFWGDTPATFSQRPGGYDPKARLDEMAVDGLQAEVLYPSLALRLFGLEDPAEQEACFRRYNEWIGEYCSVSPERLVAIGLVPAYDMRRAVAEAEWCRTHGLRGLQVWQTPPTDLAFAGAHHEPLWEACAALGMPVSLHILSGFDYSKRIYERGASLVSEGLAMYRLSITQKLAAVMDALFELVLSGVLDRHPDLRFVLVENEVGWIPFVVDQLQYYYDRFLGQSPLTLDRPPAEAFRDQVSATFFRDPNARLAIGSVGAGNFMWSNDYPHGNSTWPHSREVVADTLGALDADAFDAVTFANACALYGLELDAPSEEM
jgi:predicted TIM-barrel fold metal-dependent hydrolase